MRIKDKWVCPQCEKEMETDYYGYCFCLSCQSQYQLVSVLGDWRFYPVSGGGAIDFRYPHPIKKLNLQSH